MAKTITPFRIDSNRHLQAGLLCIGFILVLLRIGNASARAASSSTKDDNHNNGRVDDGSLNNEETGVVSKYEIPRQVAVNVRIRGDLATPAPGADIELGFVPKQTYYQVRRYDTQLHLPRSAAIDEAETAEELANAPRLREVVSHTKTQQVYEEQGYEDAAYDHAGYKKAGQRHENIRVDFPAATAKYAADDSSERAQLDDRSLELAPSDNNTNNEPIIDARDKIFANANSEDKNDSNEHKTVAKVDDPLLRKRTKVRVGTRSRQKIKNDVKAKDDDPKMSQDQLYQRSSASASAPSTLPAMSSVSYTKRRKLKDNSTLSTSDGGVGRSSSAKLAQESKTVQSKLKMKEMREEQLQQQLVKPTTYRPSSLPETLTRLRTAAVKRKPALAKSSPRGEHRSATAAAASTAPVTGSFAKNMLIDSSGYVFENPFSNMQNSREIETFVKPFATLRSKLKTNSNDGNAAGGGEYAVNERPNENQQTRQYEKVRSKKQPATAMIVGDATALFTRSKYLRPKANPQVFPYEIVDVNANVNDTPKQLSSLFEMPKKWKKELLALDVNTNSDAPNKIKTNFPYEIVTSSARWSPPAQASASGYIPNRKGFKFYSPSLRNASSSYTAENDSPWIPITPKEVYDIHGYTTAAVRRQNITGNGSITLQINVTEWPSDNLTTHRSRDTFVKRRRKMDPIRVSEHVHSLSPSPSKSTPISKRSRLQNSVVSTSYSIRHEYDSPTPMQKASSGDSFSNPLSNNWLDRPTPHRFNKWSGGASTSSAEPALSHEYLLPQIDQSFDLQQKIFNNAMVDSQSKRPSITSMVNQDIPAASDDQSHHSNDIETLSSNRYTIFRLFEHTTSPMQKSSVTYTNDDNSNEDNKNNYDFNSNQHRDKLLQYRHPYLPRETSHLPSPKSQQYQHGHYEQQSQQNSIWKKNEIFDDDKRGALGDGTNATTPTSMTTATTAKTTTTTTTAMVGGRHNITQYQQNDSTSTLKSTSIKPKLTHRLDTIIVYPVDYDSSASFVENLTLAHYADPIVNTVSTAVPLNYRNRLHAFHGHLVINKTDSSDSYTSGLRKIRSASNQQLLGVYMDGSTTEIPVDVDKYPFYKYKSTNDGNSLTKYSVLRYVSNPNSVPTKKAGQMSFYESTNHIRCPEPEAPAEIAPSRQHDSQWIGDADPSNSKGKPRVRNVGSSIRCHKIKFFGYDPLDNPFFQEQSVGFPEVFRSIDVNGDYHHHRHRRRKLVTKRAAKLGIRGNADAAANKMVRKVYLAGGFINIRPNSKIELPNENLSAAVAKDPADLYETVHPTNFPQLEFVDGSPTTASATTTMMMTTTETVAASVATGFVRNTNTTIIAGGTDTHINEPLAAVINNGHRSIMMDSQIGATSAVQMWNSSSSNNDSHYIYNWPPFKPKYKAPSWRIRNQPHNKHSSEGRLGGTDNGRGIHATSPILDIDSDIGVNANRLDSLLYVIHPDSGRGKWMKIVKVERLVDPFRQTNSSELQTLLPFKSTTVKTKTVGHRFASNNALTLHQDSCDNDLAYGFQRQQRQRSSSEMTQQTRPNEKQTSSPYEKRARAEVSVSSHKHNEDITVALPQYNVDIRHISGLLSQVAPLKASQAEINNLQTSEEDAVVDEEADIAIDDNDNDNETGDVIPTTTTTTTTMAMQARYEQQNQDSDNVPFQFPQARERLYYYVVDE